MNPHHAGLLIIAGSALWLNRHIIFGAENVPQRTLQSTQGLKLESAMVVHVADGDTFDAQINGAVERVRMIGINTPERGQRGYDSALRTATNLIYGQRVTLQADKANRDQYGRLLRYVWVGGLFVNRELVKRGAAKVMVVPPNVARIEEIKGC